MEITVSKEEFECWLPVAKSAHDNVYKKVMATLPEVADDIAESLLGTVGNDAMVSGGALQHRFNKYVTVLAFLQIFEQNDVVLTPTGFGVVSNDQLVPASAQRVSAVHEALKRDSLICQYYLLLYLTGVSGWGETRQAANSIENPLWNIRQMHQWYGTSVGAGRFYELMNIERAAMERVREYIGSEVIERMMVSIRCRRSDQYLKLAEKITPYILAYIDGDIVRQEQTYRRMLYHLEKNLDDFPEYAESDEYQASIAERYENKQEDSAFFFG